MTTKIFTRLTSNENNWEFPSVHKWKAKDQGKKNVPFENQYGFGHEEWLFNPRYNINGFQYGYIRGILHSSDSVTKYNEVHLYTVRKDKLKSSVYYLGFIKDVIVIKNDLKEQGIIKKVIQEFYTDMRSEVKNINVDLKGIDQFPFEAVVKFKMEDVNFYHDPIFQPNFNLNKYKRFQPYQLDDSPDSIFNRQAVDTGTEFIPGKSNQTSRFNRRNSSSSIAIEKLHSEIIEALESFLQTNYSLIKKNISIEKMRFDGNIADLVTKEKDSSISIYEVKTSAFGRINIRDAIAQLLDYALHAGSLRVNKLVIVSPSELTKSEIQFLNHLKNTIKIPLEYYCYKKESKVKFIHQP